MQVNSRDPGSQSLGIMWVKEVVERGWLGAVVERG
jgi:hypothetical protein